MRGCEVMRYGMIAMLLAMKVPDPKWPGMILKCDDQNKNCYWTCEWGTVTVPEIIDGNQVQISSGCVKDQPVPNCPVSNKLWGITPV
jgi:hypothetical protein